MPSFKPLPSTRIPTEVAGRAPHSGRNRTALLASVLAFLAGIAIGSVGTIYLGPSSTELAARFHALLGGTRAAGTAETAGSGQAGAAVPQWLTIPHVSGRADLALPVEARMGRDEATGRRTIVLSGLEPEVRLSAGHPDGPGTWSVDADQLRGLRWELDAIPPALAPSPNPPAAPSAPIPPAAPIPPPAPPAPVSQAPPPPSGKSVAGRPDAAPGQTGGAKAAATAAPASAERAGDSALPPATSPPRPNAAAPPAPQQAPPPEAKASTGPKPAAPPVAAASQSDAVANQVRDLLARADRQIGRKSLETPQGDNALETYQKIMALAPDDPAGPQLLDRIKSTYLLWARAAEKHGQTADARRLAERARSLDRFDPAADKP